MEQRRNKTATGHRRRGGGPRTIGDLIGGFLRKGGLEQAIEDHRLFLDWEDVVGSTTARDTKPLRIERGTLWIGVSNAPLANQLSYLKAVLLDQIRKKYPGARIRDIRFLHRPGERWSKN